MLLQERNLEVFVSFILDFLIKESVEIKKLQFLNMALEAHMLISNYNLQMALFPLSCLSNINFNIFMRKCPLSACY